MSKTIEVPDRIGFLVMNHASFQATGDDCRRIVSIPLTEEQKDLLRKKIQDGESIILITSITE